MSRTALVSRPAPPPPSHTIPLPVPLYPPLRPPSTIAPLLAVAFPPLTVAAAILHRWLNGRPPALGGCITEWLRMASVPSRSVSLCFFSPMPSSLTRGRLRCAVSKHRQLKCEERANDAAASARLHKYMFVQVIGGGKAPWTKWTFEPGDLFLHQRFSSTPACLWLPGRRLRKKKACASSGSHQVGADSYILQCSGGTGKL